MLLENFPLETFNVHAIVKDVVYPTLCVAHTVLLLTITGPIEFRDGSLQLLVNVCQLPHNQWVLHVQDGLSHTIVQTHNDVKALEVVTETLILLEHRGGTVGNVVLVGQLVQVLDLSQESHQLQGKDGALTIV